jgi:hypothetical protein
VPPIWSAGQDPGTATKQLPLNPTLEFSFRVPLSPLDGGTSDTEIFIGLPFIGHEAISMGVLFLTWKETKEAAKHVSE